MKRCLLGCLALLLTGVAVGQETRRATSWGDEVELLLFSDANWSRVTLRLEDEGRPLGHAWDKVMGRLFDYLDRDNDGTLSEVEAKRLPTPFDLRRLLWGHLTAPVGIGAGWKEVDADGDGKLTRSEVALFYQRSRVGVQVGAGRSPNEGVLNREILKALDRDRDGKLTEAELKNAEQALAALDANEDERIAPGELVKDLSYPAARGTLALEPPSETATLPTSSSIAVWLLPADRKDTRWATALVREAKGPLTVEELVRWRDKPEKQSWSVRRQKGVLGLCRKTASGEESLAVDTFSTPAIRVSLRSDPGQLEGLFATERQRLTRQFTEADIENKGVISEKTSLSRRDSSLRQLLTVADRNGDGQLTRAELDAWVELLDALQRVQLLVTILDHGRGLFEFLDADEDGRLSVRELRTAHARLVQAGCVRDGSLDLKRLPRTFRLTVSMGHPRSPLTQPVRSGPEWFRAMDRNNDGDVSRREFIGKPELFDRWDTNKDGLLSAKEAARVRP